MSKIYKNMMELIGHTPLLHLQNYETTRGVHATLLGKLESFNPAGSVKDRIAKQMINEAEKQGLLHKHTVIVEPTSGNTGIGLAAVSAAKGYRLILTMPETMSIERRNLLKAYGAEVVLTDGKKGMKGAIDKANELMHQISHAFMPSQFTNLVNPRCHVETTGPEIWEDTDGHVDVLIAGVGTGGTITGAGQYLKNQNPHLHIVAVEPTNSPVLSNGVAGSHKIQGIGAGFIPEVLDTTIYDEVITISNEQAFNTARELVQTEGLLGGISSGAALYAATEVGKRLEWKGSKIVVILPDAGERYLSTELFQV